MARRKFRIYFDADFDKDIEDALSELPGVNADSARRRVLAGRGDEDHYHLASKSNRVLVTHDGDYLDDRRHPIMKTSGVVVIKRGAGALAIITAFVRFLEWWESEVRDCLNRSAFGWLKVDLSQNGFHYWARTDEGSVVDGYVEFIPARKLTKRGRRRAGATKE